LPPAEQSRRYVELMGGRVAVVEAAERAYDRGEYQWAAELSTHLIRINNLDIHARNLKADSFKRLGYAQLNTNWKNWYLTSARELDGSLDVLAAQKRFMAAIAAPDLIAALPPGRIIEGLAVKLKAEQTLDVNLAVGFKLSDTDDFFALEIRHGIAQFHDNGVPDLDAAVELTTPALFSLLSGQLSVEEGRREGKVKVSGKSDSLADFFQYFEGLQPIQLTVR
jgi:alkyl sulfatase BDS1-like metallo-beta-lactamase superfamily hydrolase